MAKRGVPVAQAQPVGALHDIEAGIAVVRRHVVRL